MKRLIKKIKKLTGANIEKSPDSVVPFTEKPSIEPASKDMHSADALFSMFTANIIKQKIKFTR